ncbi:hypothetical protein A3A71_00030 [Candidatus Berkelbacteria bacterium RIFCSPLOWO2_01_FULL_50_28]|uniref:Thioredoxin domain-containing protein n=1 Tax=Candidatus Berkelbacteria bacterium RIFCSPLOWO2_01_FULL_50_28 TaxID=1797471 RepID=A0A1F5EAS6_9BACT|nr:MAG: hypothetical protein A2807_03265 [Candidatus Berkelbacteria bacterium RIFCSPHIGHO2_01_FULL_50_36]OGD62418.1 MAG: hypothetical protein A3F39_01800 [Candidatus Berkelbacteria bacterium RIFCSPHIGHO2_12_FULL_50_11]OGD64441.1 MAG: hypothetical protein A3A71_00030 [Candidatus Berkelbacteria bacterium RIFCSPLOWO2_01_FULL_50_28]
MRYLVPLVILLALVVGGVLVSKNRQTAEVQGDSKDSTQTVKPVTGSTATNLTTAGSYIDYDESVISRTQGTKILFFYAPWCPQCRALEADIKASVVPVGVTIIKTDYDSNQALRQKYGVTIQTTLVLVDDQGNFVKKYVAYDKPTLSSVKSNLL